MCNLKSKKKKKKPKNFGFRRVANARCLLLFLPYTWSNTHSLRLRWPLARAVRVVIYDSEIIGYPITTRAGDLIPGARDRKHRARSYYTRVTRAPIILYGRYWSRHINKLHVSRSRNDDVPGEVGGENRVDRDIPCAGLPPAISAGSRGGHHR